LAIRTKWALEVGSAYGYSAVAVAQVGTHVIAVDPHAWIDGSESAMRGNLAAYGVEYQVTIIRLPSQTALPNLAWPVGRFGLIFIDGDHAEATVEHDVTWAVKLLAPGGVLACHDYGEDTCPGVAAALDRLLGPPPELVDTLAIYRGLA
jgi:predicted O-methyltransferase YrrM